MTALAAHYARGPHSGALRWAPLRWLLRGLLGLLVTLAMLVGAGAIYQAIATEADRREFPPPGQLIDVGGYHVHLQCAGQGSPTVVLETGLGGWSTHWALIQPILAQQTRVCSYDRAGLGWSDPGPQPRDARQLASELRTLLRHAGVPAPFVLAGHSTGGLYARMFASRYGDEVAGLVLADPTAPELFERLPSARADLSNAEQQARVFQVLAPVGLVRLLMPGALEAELSAYPVRARDEIVALNSVGRQWHGLEAEVEGLPASMAEVAQTGHLGARPLVVLSSTESASASADDHPVRYALGGEAAALSSNSRYIVVPGATHSGLTAQPQYAAVTARAIQAVVDAVRSGASLPEVAHVAN